MFGFGRKPRVDEMLSRLSVRIDDIVQDARAAQISIARGLWPLFSEDLRAPLSLVVSIAITERILERRSGPFSGTVLEKFRDVREKTLKEDGVNVDGLWGLIASIRLQVDPAVDGLLSSEPSLGSLQGFTELLYDALGYQGKLATDAIAVMDLGRRIVSADAALASGLNSIRAPN